MLETRVLIARLNQVEQQRHTLSAEHKLMLLTMQNPDFNTGFFKRLLTVTVPTEWHFPHQNNSDVECSKRLIDIIIHDLIPAYIKKSLNYYWYEQCINYTLKYFEQNPTQYQIEKNIERLKDCKNNSLKTTILRKFKILKPCVNNALALAQDCKNNQLWSDAIWEYQWILQQQESLTSEDILDFSECILSRNNHYNSECTDAQMALYFLLNTSSTQERYKLLKYKAISLILPDDIIAKRGECTNIFADMGRSLNHVGKSIGNVFGGRESEIPYSKGIIANAPILLTHYEISQHLDRDKTAQDTFEKILSDRGVIASIATASVAYSAGLLWSYAQIDSTVLNALMFASKGQPEQFITLQDIAGATLGSAGAMTRLSGYVAEQQVAYNLTQQGHTVEFPDKANQAGFDLIVDGQAMQVKNTLSSDYVLQHIEKNPDIPVIVNQELTDSLGNHPNVFIDSGLSHAHVNQTMHESLEQIDQFDSMADFLPIPFITLGLATYRNYQDFDTGQTSSKQYLENIGKETAAIAGGAVAGKMILGTIGGILAGPVGIAVAGGLGAYIGGVAGSTGANALNREKLCSQRDCVVSQLIEFAQWFKNELLDYRVNQNLSSFEEVKEKLKQNQQNLALSMTFIAYQFEVYLHGHCLQHWLEAKLQGNQNEQVQAGWVALQQSEHFLSTELRQKVAKINQALEIYRSIANPIPASSEFSVIRQVGYRNNI